MSPKICSGALPISWPENSRSPSSVIRTSMWIDVEPPQLTSLMGLVIPVFYMLWSYLTVRCQTFELTTERLRITKGVINHDVMITGSLTELTVIVTVAAFDSAQ